MKKNGWFDQLVKMSEEKMKGLKLGVRRNEVKKAFEAIIEDLKLDIDKLTIQIFDLQKEIISVEPREETESETKSKLIKLIQLKKQRKAKQAQIIEDTEAMKEALENAPDSEFNFVDTDDED